MTMHIAKGLEFPAVFLVGMEDGIFPHFRSLGDPVELEEERRLCYVGITRAERFLYVSHAWSRMLWGTSCRQHPQPVPDRAPGGSAAGRRRRGRHGRTRRTGGRDPGGAAAASGSPTTKGRHPGAERVRARGGPHDAWWALAAAGKTSTGAELWAWWPATGGDGRGGRGTLLGPRRGRRRRGRRRASPAWAGRSCCCTWPAEAGLGAPDRPGRAGIRRGSRHGNRHESVRIAPYGVGVPNPACPSDSPLLRRIGPPPPSGGIAPAPTTMFAPTRVATPRSGKVMGNWRPSASRARAPGGRDAAHRTNPRRRGQGPRSAVPQDIYLDEDDAVGVGRPLPSIDSTPRRGELSGARARFAHTLARPPRRERRALRKQKRRERSTIVGRHPKTTVLLVVLVLMTPVWASLGSAATDPALAYSIRRPSPSDVRRVKPLSASIATRDPSLGSISNDCTLMPGESSLDMRSRR